MFFMTLLTLAVLVSDVYMLHLVVFQDTNKSTEDVKCTDLQIVSK